MHFPGLEKSMDFMKNDQVHGKVIWNSFFGLKISFVLAH